MTLGQLFAEYEVYHSHETRKTSHDSVMRKLRLHVLPFLSEYRLNKLTQSVLAQWRNNIADMDCSIKQKKCIYSALNAMLNYAVKMEYIPKNPLTALGNFKAPDTIDKPAEKLRYYTAEQFCAYIAQARAKAVTVTDWGILCVLLHCVLYRREKGRNKRFEVV